MVSDFRAVTFWTNDVGQFYETNPAYSLTFGFELNNLVSQGFGSFHALKLHGLPLVKVGGILWLISTLLLII
jgi:hypothetical protein